MSMDTFRWVLVFVNLLITLLNVGLLWYLLALMEEIRKLQRATQSNLDEAERLRQRLKNLNPDDKP
ncbi:MAG TPA: hypothetical protein VFO40_04905 [Chthoniobacterales bacterium]|nr:hypothetical protein [Chthoniobacterales bacterium]